jgi:hypothetical protein
MMRTRGQMRMLRRRTLTHICDSGSEGDAGNDVGAAASRESCARGDNDARRVNAT